MRRREVDAFFWHVGGELQRMTEDLMRLRPQFANCRGWEPRVDLMEEQDRLVIRGEIAGVRGEEIQLLYVPDRNVVIIRGKRNEDELSETSCISAYQLEIYYGDFEREIKLPDVEILPQEMKATYRNGILLVSLPKRVRVQAERAVIESF